MSTDQCRDTSVQLSLQLQLQQTRNLKLDRHKRSDIAIHAYNCKYVYIHIKNGQEHRFKSHIKQEIVYSCLIYNSYSVQEIVKTENMSIGIFVCLDTYTSSRRPPVNPATLAKSSGVVADMIAYINPDLVVIL